MWIRNNSTKRLPTEREIMRKREDELSSIKKQLRDLRRTIEELTQENAAAKGSVSELTLKKEELLVCTAELDKARASKSRCERWADELDEVSRIESMLGRHAHLHSSVGFASFSPSFAARCRE